MRAALYARHYIHSTHDYGITFTSSDTSPIHTYVLFPDSSDVEVYTDAIPPSWTKCAPLTSYSNACWGLQIGSAVCDGTLLPLFKFRSMSGDVVFDRVGHYHGCVLDRIRLPSARVKPKSAPQMKLPNQW
jgi:hypothetical protein